MPENQGKVLTVRTIEGVTAKQDGVYRVVRTEVFAIDDRGFSYRFHMEPGAVQVGDRFRMELHRVPEEASLAEVP